MEQQIGERAPEARDDNAKAGPARMGLSSGRSLPLRCRQRPPSLPSSRATERATASASVAVSSLRASRMRLSDARARIGASTFAQAHFEHEVELPLQIGKHLLRQIGFARQACRGRGGWHDDDCRCRCGIRGGRWGGRDRCCGSRRGDRDLDRRRSGHRRGGHGTLGFAFRRLARFRPRHDLGQGRDPGRRRPARAHSAASCCLIS